MTKVKRVINIKQERCRGLDSRGEDVFNEEKIITIRVYEDGARIPVCEYFEGIEAPRCNPHLEIRKNKNLENYWLCKYYNSGK